MVLLWTVGIITMLLIALPIGIVLYMGISQEMERRERRKKQEERRKKGDLLGLR